jgi:hypothetical protein
MGEELRDALQGKKKLMKRSFCLYILLIPFFLLACASNIQNISKDIGSSESIIVGRIETVPILWEFSLYEEESKTEDQIDIAGKGYGISKESKLQNQGYIFKIARPGSYILRLQKRIGHKKAYDDILRFEVPEGKLVYLGTIRVVIEQIERPMQGDQTSKRIPVAFKYRYVHIDEKETLKHFQDQYPQAYSAYKDKMIRVLPSSSKKQYI